MKKDNIESALWLIPLLGYILYMTSRIIDQTTERKGLTSQALDYAILRYHVVMAVIGIATYLILATWDK